MQFVTRTCEGQTETWCIRRPERLNALGTQIAAQLLDVLNAAQSSLPLTRLIILTADPVVNGPKRTWVAGGDLTELAVLAGREQARSYAGSLAQFVQRLDALPVPVIVAIDGAAIGGGAELALAGDVRIATQGSVFDFRQLQVGLATGYASTRRLCHLVGGARAKQWLLTGAAVSAEAAFAAGLLNSVVTGADELRTELARLSRYFLQLEPAAVQAQKRMLWHAANSHPGTLAAEELAIFGDLWRNPTHSQFLDHFVEHQAEKRRQEA